MEIAAAAARLEALGNPTRLAILRLLVRAGEDGLAVGRIQARLGIAPSTLSHHLRSLVAADLLAQDRAGTALICRANFALIRALGEFLIAECCADVAEGDAA